jgi:hypothetical protein
VRRTVCDAAGEKEPQAFLRTDLRAEPTDILRWFVRRWRTETTVEEARRHLGTESQRQWTDLAILRTTPALLGLFSLVALWAGQLATERGPVVECVRWYPKPPCRPSVTLSRSSAASCGPRRFSASHRLTGPRKMPGPI